jgi:predicted RecA/RadA family phage recombinase
MTVNLYNPSGGSAGNSVGAEVSSSYEGRVITLEESLLVHPTHSGGLVNKGDPVVVGRMVGVALKSAAAATDQIPIDTEGIWDLNVFGSISDGTADGAASALAVGAPVYINKTTAVLSGISDGGNWLPFGTLLTEVASGVALLTLAAVKVHREVDNQQLFSIPDAAPSGGSAPGFVGGSVAGAWSNSIKILVNGVVKYIPVYDLS